MTCVAFASRKAHGVYAVGARADEEHVALAQCERARLGNAVGEDADLEAGRKLDALERQALGGRRLRERERDARASARRALLGRFSFTARPVNVPIMRNHNSNKRFSERSR